jgi:hypothetical protein
MVSLTELASVAGSGATVIALFGVWRQLRYQSRQLRQTALTALHKDILDPEVQRAIRAIYAADPASLAEPKTPEDLERIELILNQYDLIGTRLEYGLLPKKQTVSTEWPVILRLWCQLQPFIESEARLRPGVPYKPGFVWLVQQSERYKQKHFPSASTTPFTRSFAKSHPRKEAKSHLRKELVE